MFCEQLVLLGHGSRFQHQLGGLGDPHKIADDALVRHSDRDAMWARRHGTKFNGAPYIVQRAGEAVYSDAGKAQLKEQVGYYMKNAKAIKEGLTKAGYTVFGGGRLRQIHLTHEVQNLFPSFYHLKLIFPPWILRRVLSLSR